MLVTLNEMYVNIDELLLNETTFVATYIRITPARFYNDCWAHASIEANLSPWNSKQDLFYNLP